MGEAQAFMKPGYKASIVRGEKVEDVFASIVVDSIKYIVSYDYDHQEKALSINFMVTEKTYRELGEETLSIETQQKVGMALSERVWALHEASH